MAKSKKMPPPAFNGRTLDSLTSSKTYFFCYFYPRESFFCSRFFILLLYFIYSFSPDVKELRERPAVQQTFTAIVIALKVVEDTETLPPAKTLFELYCKVGAINCYYFGS